MFADLFDAASYCATPFINQCLFIAGVAFIHDAQMEEYVGEMGRGGHVHPQPQHQPQQQQQQHERSPGGHNSSDRMGGGGGASSGAAAGGGSSSGNGSGSNATGGRNIPMDFLNSLVKQNLSAIFKALRRMERYWGGLAYIIDVLEQRASGRGWATVDFSISGEKGTNFISLPDMGLMKRVAAKNDNGEVRY